MLDIQFNYFLLNFNLIYFFLDVKLLFTPTSLPNNVKVQESFSPELKPGMCVCGGGGQGGEGILKKREFVPQVECFHGLRWYESLI